MPSGLEGSSRNQDANSWSAAQESVSGAKRGGMIYSGVVDVVFSVVDVAYDP
jgi:hypothetical protein